MNHGPAGLQSVANGSLGNMELTRLSGVVLRGAIFRTRMHYTGWPRRGMRHRGWTSSDTLAQTYRYDRTRTCAERTTPRRYRRLRGILRDRHAALGWCRAVSKRARPAQSYLPHRS
jgi:hypothetical protein